MSYNLDLFVYGILEVVCDENIYLYHLKNTTPNHKKLKPRYRGKILCVLNSQTKDFQLVYFVSVLTFKHHSIIHRACRKPRFYIFKGFLKVFIGFLGFNAGHKLRPTSKDLAM